MVKLARRALEAATALFAVYAFVTVPLGSRTGLQHVRAILGTEQAREAGQEIKQAGGRILGELLEFEPGEIRGEPQVPEELLAPSESLSTTSEPAPEAASAPERPSRTVNAQ